MKIVPFIKEYTKEAQQLAFDNYREEQRQIPCLPHIENVPNLTYFAENGLGVAAFEEGKMIGFLGCYEPQDNKFDTVAKGLFSPIQAHGAQILNRELIYQRMYQEAAKHWVEQGITYHGISLYAHDQAAIHAFFTYGFGHRCTDAIRAMECFGEYKEDAIEFRELMENEKAKVFGLQKALSDHMGESPCFMYSTDEEFLVRVKDHEEGSRMFVAEDGDKPIAFLKISDDAETFVADEKDMKNITGTYCLPEYRGRGIYQRLIQYVIRQLSKEQYHYLGVDYESINPTANYFWQKYFTPYTNSVVRRVDEGVLRKYMK